ncbi:hypothetical protein B0I35DRAFT_441174 [Stachybotrys elegans]|uniref:Uncharacterized protein n=1 Tax=Stachybotrys elegans TaxID=80388 RepID=A0A8K0SIG0_9HYPO|nr:hypothetical protein B0I35DRAFT_441174 [Stachybotrys elegans]
MWTTLCPCAQKLYSQEACATRGSGGLPLTVFCRLPPAACRLCAQELSQLTRSKARLNQPMAIASQSAAVLQPRRIIRSSDGWRPPAARQNRQLTSPFRPEAGQWVAQRSRRQDSDKRYPQAAQVTWTRCIRSAIWTCAGRPPEIAVRLGAQCGGEFPSDRSRHPASLAPMTVASLHDSRTCPVMGGILYQRRFVEAPTWPSDILIHFETTCLHATYYLRR